MERGSLHLLILPIQILALMILAAMRAMMKMVTVEFMFARRMMIIPLLVILVY